MCASACTHKIISHKTLEHLLRENNTASGGAGERNKTTTKPRLELSDQDGGTVRGKADL